MTKVTFDTAKKWLENINDKDNVAIIHDTDMDGTCAGILAMDFCEKKKCHVEEFGFYRAVSEFKDFNIKSFNKIIILDLGNNLIEGNEEKLRDKEALFIDHHQGQESHFGKNILEYRTVSGICTSRSVWELSGGREWIALLGAYSDAGEKYKENDEWFRKFESSLDIPVKEFKEENLYLYSSILIYFGKDTKTPFNIIRKFKHWKDVRLCENYWKEVEEEKRKIVEKFYISHEILGDAKYFYFEPHFDIKSPVINKISFADESSTFIFAVPKEKDKIGISCRSQSKEYNMSDLVKFCIKDLKNATGGGHPAAAGCFFEKKDLPKFKENVKKYFENHKN